MGEPATRETRPEAREIAPWRPWREVARMQREMDRLFDDMRPWWPARLAARRFAVDAPAVDVYEEKDAIVVKAELPGMSKENIQVSVEEGALTIRGEKKREEKIEEKDYAYQERSYGAFTRTIGLPAAVKADQVTAQFKHGVLEVRLPRAEESKPKTVSVKVQ